MLLDITYRLTAQTMKDAQGHQDKSLIGHQGTHFDVMDKEFPLEYTRRKGMVFDVSGVADRDICSADIALDRVEAGMFAAFYTGYIEKVGYGSKEYFGCHPQLSDELIENLLEKGVSIIGVDFAGIRRGREHTPKDQYCAERNCFVIENLCGLQEVLAQGGAFTAHTYPMNYAGATGLPCRVIAEI